MQKNTKNKGNVEDCGGIKPIKPLPMQKGTTTKKTTNKKGTK